MTNRISISAVTDMGKERSNNEDAFIFCPDMQKGEWQEGGSKSTGGYTDMGSCGSVTIVADGMGGANAGEVASAIATHSVMTTLAGKLAAYADGKAVSEEDAAAMLKEAVVKADADINAHMLDHHETIGMGTTIVIAWMLEEKTVIAWCGDSRCYVFNPSTGLRRLTKDHSLVQEMVDRGQITEEEAFNHPDSNIITRGLGGFDSAVVPDIVVHTLSPSDMLLLCSDGLCGYCTDKDIARTLGENHPDTTRCSDALLRLALDAGGYDNVCIAVAAKACDGDTCSACSGGNACDADDADTEDGGSSRWQGFWHSISRRLKAQ